MHCVCVYVYTDMVNPTQIAPATNTMHNRVEYAYLWELYRLTPNTIVFCGRNLQWSAINRCAIKAYELDGKRAPQHYPVFAHCCITKTAHFIVSHMRAQNAIVFCQTYSQRWLQIQNRVDDECSRYCCSLQQTLMAQCGVWRTAYGKIRCRPRYIVNLIAMFKIIELVEHRMTTPSHRASNVAFLYG